MLLTKGGGTLSGWVGGWLSRQVGWQKERMLTDRPQVLIHPPTHPPTHLPIVRYSSNQAKARLSPPFPSPVAAGK